MNLVRKLKSKYKEKPIVLSPLAELTHRLKHVSRFTLGETEIFGWNIQYVDAPAMLSSLDLLVEKGWNDFHTNKKNPLILDCGANIGISVLRYKQLYPEAQIIAFEPDEKIYHVLRRNIEVNHLANVETVQAAVWTEKGRQLFLSDGADGSRLTSETPNQEEKQYFVPTIRLADYLAQGDIDFVKIDIEGAELAVLESCRNVIQHVRQLVVEVHYRVDQPNTLSQILYLLANAGFNVSINVIAPWLDLRKPFQRIPNTNADQYLLVCAWQS